jgi:hypothetical protein
MQKRKEIKLLVINYFHQIKNNPLFFYNYLNSQSFFSSFYCSSISYFFNKNFQTINYNKFFITSGYIIYFFLLLMPIKKEKL